MRLLLAGFEPFGGVPVNPSQRAVERIAAAPPEGVTVQTLILPVSYRRAWPVLLAAVDLSAPEVVLLTGLAAGRAVLSVERLAVNRDDAPIADNDDERRCDTPIDPAGSAAYVATVPVRAMVAAAAACGSALSLSAGTFVCNHVLYRLCHHVATTGAALRCGFVHVPLLPGLCHGQPCMDLATMERGLRAMLKAL